MENKNTSFVSAKILAGANNVNNKSSYVDNKPKNTNTNYNKNTYEDKPNNKNSECDDQDKAITRKKFVPPRR